jgi:hypothetical protein
MSESESMQNVMVDNQEVLAALAAHDRGEKPFEEDILKESEVQYRYYDSHKNGPLKYERVQPCQHKFVPGGEPRHRNCQPCWFTFFQVYQGLTKTAEEVLRTEGEHALIQIRHAKFYKHYKRYVATMAKWKEMADTAAIVQQVEEHNKEVNERLGLISKEDSDLIEEVNETQDKEQDNGALQSS